MAANFGQHVVRNTKSTYMPFFNALNVLILIYVFITNEGVHNENYGYMTSRRPFSKCRPQKLAKRKKISMLKQTVFMIKKNAFSYNFERHGSIIKMSVAANG